MIRCSPCSRLVANTVPWLRASKLRPQAGPQCLLIACAVSSFQCHTVSRAIAVRTHQRAIQLARSSLKSRAAAAATTAEECIRRDARHQDTLEACARTGRPIAVNAGPPQGRRHAPVPSRDGGFPGAHRPMGLKRFQKRKFCALCTHFVPAPLLCAPHPFFCVAPLFKRFVCP